MSEQMIKSLPSISDWGVPDWRDASAYPNERMSLRLWRWEFLRRRDDYREDWLKYAPETYERIKAKKEANSMDQGTLGHKGMEERSIGGDIFEDFSELLLPITDLAFLAKMPGSGEKYELGSLLNPANPRPLVLSFGSGDLRGLKWEVGRGKGLCNYWGIEYAVEVYELMVRIDLTMKPARALMASFTKARPISPETRECLEIENNRILNIPNMFLANNSKRFPSLKECPASLRNCIRNPEHPGIVHVIWDLRLPLRQQKEDITALLTRLQKALPNKPQARRVRRSAWPNFLRVLDARAVNPKTQKPYAKYEEIGYEVFNSRGYASAKAQAKTAHNDAIRLMNDFPP